MNGCGQLGALLPGKHAGLGVVVTALGQRASLLNPLELQTGGHLGSVDPGVHLKGAGVVTGTAFLVVVTGTAFLMVEVSNRKSLLIFILNNYTIICYFFHLICYLHNRYLK